MTPHSKYSCLENLMDRGAWWAAVHGVVKSRTGLSDFTFSFTSWSGDKIGKVTITINEAAEG